jgi:hypothetical protein
MKSSRRIDWHRPGTIKSSNSFGVEILLCEASIEVRWTHSSDFYSFEYCD